MNYIFAILCLKEYLRRIFGSHYPIEIVELIMMIHYRRPKISWSYQNCFAIVDDQCYVWGENINGELGLGHYEKINQLTKLLLPNIRKIKCVTRGTFALTNSGDIYGWGCLNRYTFGLENRGNLPHKLGFDKIKQIKSYDSHYSCLLIKNDRIFILNDTIVEHILPSINKISCGVNHIIALTNDKSIYGMGLNDWGQLGLALDPCYHNLFEKISLRNVLAVKCGQYYTIALTLDGLYGWGDNRSGQLGLGDVVCRYTPTKLNFQLQRGEPIAISRGRHHTMILLKQDQVYVFGNTRILIPQKLNLNFNIRQISCCFNKTLMIGTDNRVYLWDLDKISKINVSDVIGIDSYYDGVAFVTKAGQVYVYGNTRLGNERDSLIKLELPY